MQSISYVVAQRCGNPNTDYAEVDTPTKRTIKPLSYLESRRVYSGTLNGTQEGAAGVIAASSERSRVTFSRSYGHAERDETFGL